MIIKCKEEDLVLNKEKAVYWPAKKMLIISDVHIGKSAYFRKSGIQVPNAITHTDLQRLSSMIREYHPEKLLITGDLFHNNINSDANAFLNWRKEFDSINMILVKGNHDSLKDEDYRALGLETYAKELLVYPFRFIHDQPAEADEYYNISGHLHPGVILYGKARQQLRFPCFYFGQYNAILPAFSVFTGLKAIQPREGDRFYAITPSKIIAV